MCVLLRTFNWNQVGILTQSDLLKVHVKLEWMKDGWMNEQKDSILTDG